ncbi:type II toxin-antitoxin system Phd/YefM family antitoxin [Streptomyces sp. NPDC048663]|uniref:type II toxin-antitoxin system Phd/YefM family antitoxin n=1 Tax=Streptomyces sp. NPDC048663 TaxID=3155638 RepID=UPI0034444B98
MCGDAESPWCSWPQTHASTRRPSLRSFEVAATSLQGTSPPPVVPRHRDERSERMLRDVMPICAVRTELGPIVRWVARRRERVTITHRGRPTAVLIGVPELAELDRTAAAGRDHSARCPTCSPGTGET